MNTINYGFSSPFLQPSISSSFFLGNSFGNQSNDFSNNLSSFIQQQLVRSIIGNIFNQLIFQLSTQLNNNHIGGANVGDSSKCHCPHQPPIIANSTVGSNISLSSDQSIPPNNANGTGTGNISVNKSTGELSGSFTFSNLTDDITVAHIHAGRIGETGPIIVDLEKDPNRPNIYNIPQGSKLEGQNLKDLLAGNAYVNAHTEANPAGEVRGQVVGLSPDVARLSFGISSAQSIPPNNANGTGSGNIDVDRNTGELDGFITFSNLTGPANMVHIHAGKIGETGPVLLTLEQDSNNPNRYHIPQGSVFEGQNLKDILAGNTYINVHTEQNAPGEVRGQILSSHLHKH